MPEQLKSIAREIRKHIVRMHRRGPNVGSAMSIADILAVLYFDTMKIDRPDAPGRDRFILGKGHATSALYATLALKGFFPEAMLTDYLADGSPLTGHPVRGSAPGIEVTSGSLGHGLPIGVGMALAAKNEGASRRVFVLMGDGECQEGTVWEGAILAARLELGNLTAIVDANDLQGYERAGNLLPLANMESAWRSFGWHVLTVDGHDVEALREALSFRSSAGKPTAVIARTVKGKGVAEMEDKLGWHYYSVPPDKLQSFLDELDRGGE